MPNDTSPFGLYAHYLTMDGETDREREISLSRSDLLEDMVNSPDYQPTAKRNGKTQPCLFTRGGEKYTYNVICRPGDVLYAGDIIDVFGAKWIVMEARADKTTHMTGIAQQCNHLFRFQTFDAEIVERWGYIDISGYSSAFNANTQLQKSEEQVALYLPYDDKTAQIFVDKRLPSHIGYDAFGEQILCSFKVTGMNPVSESFNEEDHLLMLKAVRDLFAHDRDRIDLMLCDYVEPGEAPETPEEPDPALLQCGISGGASIRIGSKRSYTATFYAEDGETPVENITPQWDIAFSPGGLTVTPSGNKCTIAVPSQDALIGETIMITVKDADGNYTPCEFEVEVVGIG